MGIFLFPKDANFRKKPQTDVHYLFKVFRSKPFDLSHKGCLKTFKGVVVSLTFYYDVEDKLYYFCTDVDATYCFPRFNMNYICSYRDVNLSFALYHASEWLFFCGIHCQELYDLINSVNERLRLSKPTSFRRVHDNLCKRLIRKYTTFATPNPSSDDLPF